MPNQPEVQSAGAGAHIRANADLAFAEYKFSAWLIFFFLLLNSVFDKIFGINGGGFPATLIFWTAIAIMLMGLAHKIPFEFVMFFGAFCAGLAAYSFYNDFQDCKALYAFAYWMSLSILTIRMKRVFSGMVFALSLGMLLLLAIKQ